MNLAHCIALRKSYGATKNVFQLFFHINTIVEMSISTTFYFIPVPDAGLSKGLDRGEEGVLPAEYSLARVVNGAYEFDHKFVVMENASGQTTFQILTKDGSGNFTEARPENSFPIEGRYVQLSMVDIFVDGSQYKITLDAGSSTAAANHVVLHAANRPNFSLAEVRVQDASSQHSELEFIGTIDIRAGITGQICVAWKTGDVLELSSANGDLLFRY